MGISNTEEINLNPEPTGSNIAETGYKRGQSAKAKLNYDSIFEQASDAIMVTDFDGNFIDFNDSFCRMCGYSREQLLCLNIRNLIEPEQLKAKPMQFDRVVNGHHVLSERRMITKNGSVLEVEANVKKFGDSMQLAILRDVTEMRKAQKMIQQSEARFRGAFEHAAIGMALVSLTGEWLKVNKELCSMVGYTETEMLARTIHDIIHPEDIDKDLSLFQQTLDGAIEYYRIEQRYVHKNGFIIWINLNTSIVKDEYGQALYFVSQIENISARKQSDAALKQSEANLHAIFDTTDTAYAMVDSSLKVISFNKYAEDFALNEIGVLPRDGASLSDYFLEERRPFIEKAIPEVFGGRHINYEANYPQADGSVHWYYVRLYPIACKDKKEVFGLMLAIDNITRRKEADIQREKMSSDLIARNKDLEQFTHILSHNVRSHVARLMGLTNILMEFEIDDRENKEIVQGISESASGLDEVVRSLNDILQFRTTMDAN